MLQIAKGARIIAVVASLGRLFMSYILLTLGSTRSGYYGLGTVVLGGPIYFASLLIAIRTKMSWLFTLVVCLGALIGAMVLFVCVVAFVTEPQSRWFPILVLLTLAAYGTVFSLDEKENGSAFFGVTTWVEGRTTWLVWIAVEVSPFTLFDRHRPNLSMSVIACYRQRRQRSLDLLDADHMLT